MVSMSVTCRPLLRVDTYMHVGPTMREDRRYKSLGGFFILYPQMLIVTGGRGLGRGSGVGSDILDSTEVIIRELGATSLNFWLPCYFLSDI